MPRIRALAIAAAVALVATGCFRSDIGVVVNDDGSGQMTMVFAVNAKALSEFGAGFGAMDPDFEADDFEDPCAEIREDAEATAAMLPGGGSVEPYVDGDFCGVRLTVQFGPGDDVSTSLEQALGGTAEVGAGGFETFRIERDGDGWVFEAHPAGAEDDFGFDGDFGDDPFTRQFLEGASNIVRVKLPGRQVEHNADRIDDDGTMIWNLNVLGDNRVLRARTAPGEPIRGEVVTDAGRDVTPGAGATPGAAGTGSGGGGFPWVVVIVLVAIAAVGGFLLWKRSQAQRVPAPAGGSGPTAPPPPTAGAVAASPGAPAATPPPPPPSAPAPPPPAPEAAGSDPAPSQSAETTSEPQWDPARGAYIQWDAAGGHWLQYDDAAGQWRPIE